MATLKSFYYLFFLSIVLTSCGTEGPAADAEPPATTEEAPVAAPMHNTLTEAEVADGWELLFDGETTDKWRGYNRESFPNQGWGVKDGELQVFHSGTEEDGFGGDIITRAPFEDFIFTVDFALTDTSNSGIFYLVQELEDTPIWHSAPEFQLLDDETYKAIMEITPGQLTGANYDMHPQEVNYSNPIGEWNTARIEKRGNEVKHYLNEQLVIAYTLYDEDWESRYQQSKFNEYPFYARASSGPLGLQDHGHLCRFRNIKVKRL